MKTAQIFSLLHLTIAFVLISWIVLYPFMEEHFATKFQRDLLSSVMTNPRFEEVSPTQKERIFILQNDHIYESKTPFFKNFFSGISTLLLTLPPFERAWILFSLLIPIGVLRRWKGVQRAVWLLPIIVFFWGIDQETEFPKATLFPQESYIVEHYLQEPLLPDVGRQMAALQAGFDRYLAFEWAKNGATFEEKVIDGRFWFNVERLLNLEMEPKSISLPSFVFLLFLIWNAFYAFVTWRKLVSP